MAELLKGFGVELNGGLTQFSCLSYLALELNLPTLALRTKIADIRETASSNVKDVWPGRNLHQGPNGAYLQAQAF